MVLINYLLSMTYASPPLSLFFLIYIHHCLVFKVPSEKGLTCVCMQVVSICGMKVLDELKSKIAETSKLSLAVQLHYILCISALPLPCLLRIVKTSMMQNGWEQIIGILILHYTTQTKVSEAAILVHILSSTIGWWTHPENNDSSSH